MSERYEVTIIIPDKWSIVGRDTLEEILEKGLLEVYNPEEREGISFKVEEISS